MAKEIGADRLGDFYTNGKVRKRREWRGLKDTMYAYMGWLGFMGTAPGRPPHRQRPRVFQKSGAGGRE